MLPEDNPDSPSTEHTEEGEDGHGAHSEGVSRCISLSEEIRSVDERSIRDRSHHGDSDGFLLLSLRTNGGGPSEDDTVDTIGPETEDDHRNVSACGIGRRQGWGEDESKDGDQLTPGDVPSSLIVLSRSPRDKECSETGDQVRWAGLLDQLTVAVEKGHAHQDQSQNGALPECLYYRREKVLEPIGRPIDKQGVVQQTCGCLRSRTSEGCTHK